MSRKVVRNHSADFKARLSAGGSAETVSAVIGQTRQESSLIKPRVPVVPSFTDEYVVW